VRSENNSQGLTLKLLRYWKTKTSRSSTDNTMLKKISQFQISLEESIVNYCDTLSTKKRLLSVIILSSFFGLATLYIMVSAFHNIKKASARQMKIEQIKQLHLHSSDSVQQLKLKYHEEDKEAKKHKSPANDTTLRD